MGIKLPDHSAAGPKEKRWFNWMLGLAVAAGLVFYGRVAFVMWGKGELAKRTAAAGTDERMVGSAYEFLQQLELGNQIGWALLMIASVGFLICGGMWMRETKRRSRGIAKPKKR
jgi:hypothetical protein